MISSMSPTWHLVEVLGSAGWLVRTSSPGSALSFCRKGLNPAASKPSIPLPASLCSSFRGNVYNGVKDRMGEFKGLGGGLGDGLGGGLWTGC